MERIVSISCKYDNLIDFISVILIYLCHIRHIGEIGVGSSLCFAVSGKKAESPGANRCVGRCEQVRRQVRVGMKKGA